MKRANSDTFTNDDLRHIRYIASSYVPEGAYHKAITIFEGLNALEENVFDLQSLGALYLEVGDNEKALLCLEKALALDPKHEISALNKVKALMLGDKKKEALKAANAFVKICKDNTLLEEAKFIISILE